MANNATTTRPTVTAERLAASAVRPASTTPRVMYTTSRDGIVAVSHADALGLDRSQNGY